jgi:hypothetical protein
MFKTIFVFFLILTTYFLASFYIEKQFFDFEKQLPKTSSGYNFLVIMRRGLGEREFIERIKIASQNIGWQCYFVSSKLSFWENFFLKNPVQKVIDTLNPDFTITLEGHNTFKSNANYLALSAGVDKYFKGDPDYDSNRLYDFDGFLTSFADEKPLRQFIEQKKTYLGIAWYPTCQVCSYIKLDPLKIFYSGNNWDAKRNSAEYKKLFSALDAIDVIKIYGPKEKWKHTPRNAQGTFPFDGMTLFKKMQECGIALVLHSESHLRESAPSARIFEAAASSCVIISDKLEFIEKQFADTVLYIDEDKDFEVIFEQIKAHINWIKQNPGLALEKAKKAHEIFIQNYSLEDQLLSLGLMHKQMVAKKL